MAFTQVRATGQAEGFPGTWADNYEAQDSMSGFNQDVVAIPFGNGVVKADNVKGVKNPVANNDVVEGICMHSYAHAPGLYGDLDAAGILPKWGVNVGRRGRARVAVDDGIVAILPFTDRASLRWEADGAGKLVVGRWTNVAPDAHTIDCTKQVQFVGPLLVAPDGTKYAVVEFNFVAKP